MLRTFLRKSHNKEPEKGRFFRVQVELRIKLFLIQNIVDDIYIYISCITLMALDYGKYGIFLMGNAGFISSTVLLKTHLSPSVNPQRRVQST